MIDNDYLFIDGACFRNELDRISNDYFNGNKIDISYDGSAFHFFNKILYYDALPARRDKESDEDYEKNAALLENFFEKLMLIDRFHVYQGTVKRRSNRKWGYEQKKVDIMIAVDMLQHAFRKNMYACTLLTSDLDFKPLIDAVVQAGIDVTLWYPPQTNKELIFAADRKKLLNVDSVYGMTTEEFKQMFKLPKIDSVKLPQIQGMELIYSGESSAGKEIRIHKNDTGYKVIFDKNKHDSYVFANFHDLEVIKKYVDEIYKIKIGFKE